ncbi:hypothetical protein Ahy_B10g100667 [Arachis hypogaea]|uniref:Ubiquitin-like protease family profile domain-containing protein n=1 Tax=Arachis hypogaea TaxID=3818 RepID=A0A444WX99_ARAHY|nr:hypothetical protein Ahy_B10g100667 [Arachis hypogaea]
MQLSKIHYASLKARSHIEAGIVTAMYLILNKQKIKRFKEQIYCLLLSIVNMAIRNHAGGKFLHTKSQKSFDIQDYKMFIPFLDLKKLASHPFGYVVFRMRVYAGGQPLKKDDDKIQPPYINISGQKTSFDCVIYVMTWLEIIEPENIKKGRYDWDNWTQAEVDHFKVEYASQILFDEINRDRDTAISESEAIRLSKPSAILLSSYCQIDSDDFDTD